MIELRWKFFKYNKKEESIDIFVKKKNLQIYESLILSFSKG